MTAGGAGGLTAADGSGASRSPVREIAAFGRRRDRTSGVGARQLQRRIERDRDDERNRIGRLRTGSCCESPRLGLGTRHRENDLRDHVPGRAEVMMTRA